MIIEITVANKAIPDATWTETFEKNPNEVEDPRAFAEEQVRRFNNSPWTEEREMPHPDQMTAFLGGFLTASYRRTYEKHDGTRPADPERVLKGVSVRQKDEWPFHNWVKASTMMEEDRSGNLYDWYVCKRCYVVGRGGVRGDVELEHAYRKSRVYHHCDRAKDHLQRHGHPSGLSEAARRAQRFIQDSLTD